MTIPSGLPTEKLAVLRAIEQGRHVCVTGCAGTGKSYLLHIIRSLYGHKGLAITATTGIAAVQVGGMTLHAFAGLGAGQLPREEIVRMVLSKRGAFVRRRLKATRILAIDEISMLQGDVLDTLDLLLREVRQNPAPFGGVQLLLFGDFCQLPPIPDLNNNQQPLWCFEAESWTRARIQVLPLQQVFRQEDQLFVDLLNRIRMGSFTKEDMNLLQSRMRPVPMGDIRPTLLTTHNKQADQMNAEALSALQSRGHSFQMSHEGEERHTTFLKKYCLAPELLTLKEGAQVMMLKNTLQKEGISNGSLGVVEGFENGYPYVRFHNGKAVVVRPAEWELEALDPNTHKIVTLGQICQVPLQLAWAITIHKSQGMTLDAIECDIANAFAEGHVYVALSRVKSLDGLFLRSFNPARIRTNSTVQAFYRGLEAVA